jgi:hypothetical protein
MKRYLPAFTSLRTGYAVYSGLTGCLGEALRSYSVAIALSGTTCFTDTCPESFYTSFNSRGCSYSLISFAPEYFTISKPSLTSVVPFTLSFLVAVPVAESLSKAF